MTMLVEHVIVTAILLWHSASGVDVQTEYGTVRGQTVPVNNGQVTVDVNSFYAIPFAATTAGDNRFRAPIRPDPWTDVYIASTQGQVCGQDFPGFPWITHQGWTNFGEDCLNINIFAPTDQSGAPYPVMLWMYGGAYQGGCNLNYPGHFLASYGVVVAVPNYRTGNLGYLYTADEAAPGNAGVWDQIMASEFVRDNIAGFGGNPDMVTLFGQSAGGTSTGILQVSPKTQGLYHQYIMESGVESNPWTINFPSAHPENYTLQVAEKLNCTRPTNQEMVDCLRELPWEDVDNEGFDCPHAYICLGMSPVVDGPDGAIPAVPKDIRDSGNFYKGPMLTGITRDEAALGLAGLAGVEDGFSRAEMELIWAGLAVYMTPVLGAKEAQDMATAADWRYTPWPYINDAYKNREYLAELLTDISFGFGWDYELKSQAAFEAPSYGYIFDYRSPEFPISALPPAVGVPHIGDIPYVWGFPLLEFNEAVANDSLIFLQRAIDGYEEDVAYSTFMMQLWTNFAKYSNPTPAPVEAPNNIGEVSWDPFTTENMNYFYITNTTVFNGQEWHQKSYAFIDEYLTYLTDGFIPWWDPYPDPERKDEPKSHAFRKQMRNFVTNYLERYGDLDLLEKFNF